MELSREMRRLQRKWDTRDVDGWPKWLEWVEIDGLRGWHNERIEFRFPIMAIIGENGVGKSTILQSAAAVYKAPGRGVSWYASGFFPPTFWEEIKAATISYRVSEGDSAPREGTVRKPEQRWHGNRERAERHIRYFDLNRLQPVAARPGYQKLVKEDHRETRQLPFEASRLSTYSDIMGRTYDGARMAVTNIRDRRVPVLGQHGVEYSGYHQGAGETTIMELLGPETPETTLVLIDEIETSLHPRVQRRLIRYLAELCLEKDVQVIITTHSPVILDELPTVARAYITSDTSGRRVLHGVSTEFAMSSMDDVQQYECEVYVEDRQSAIWLTEILAASQMDPRPVHILPCGSAGVGISLGQMVSKGLFPRSTLVYLDGDQAAKPGCVLLPGRDSPEEVVFQGLAELSERAWASLDQRVARDYGAVANACTRATSRQDSHDWVDSAATELRLPGDFLWRAMCGEWARTCLTAEERERVVRPIMDTLAGIPNAWLPPADRSQSPVHSAVAPAPAAPAAAAPAVAPPRRRTKTKAGESSTGQSQLFARSPDASPPTASSPEPGHP